MKINVIDVESTCWDTNVDIPSEIIQVGISQFNTDTREITPAFSVFIKPIFSDTLSNFCKGLTGLTDEQVFNGLPYVEAMNELQSKFNIRKTHWGSWGDYDRRMFADNARLNGVSNIMCNQHLNIKIMYSVLSNTKKGLGMDKAVAQLGLEIEGRHHDGGDDAYNTARILERITRRR